MKKGMAYAGVLWIVQYGMLTKIAEYEIIDTQNCLNVVIVWSDRGVAKKGSAMTACWANH